MIFKLGAMPYGIVERSMTLFGEEVMPRIRRVLDDDAAAQRAVAAPALYGVGGSSEGRLLSRAIVSAVYACTKPARSIYGRAYKAELNRNPS
jgi:hypothetical protein